MTKADEDISNVRTELPVVSGRALQLTNDRYHQNQCNPYRSSLDSGDEAMPCVFEHSVGCAEERSVTASSQGVISDPPQMQVPRGNSGVDGAGDEDERQCDAIRNARE